MDTKKCGLELGCQTFHLWHDPTQNKLIFYSTDDNMNKFPQSPTQVLHMQSVLIQIWVKNLKITSETSKFSTEISSRLGCVWQHQPKRLQTFLVCVTTILPSSSCFIIITLVYTLALVSLGYALTSSGALFSSAKENIMINNTFHQC